MRRGRERQGLGETLAAMEAARELAWDTPIRVVAAEVAMAEVATAAGTGRVAAGGAWAAMTPI